MASDPVSHDVYLHVAGMLLQNAAATDHFMFMGFKILSNIKDVRIAKAIFYNLDSFQQRENLIKRVMDINPDPETDRLLNAIMEAAKKSNNQRKAVAHGILFHEKPDQNSPFKILLPKQMGGVPTTVTRDSLQTLLDHSKDAFISGQAAFQSLCERHKVLPLLEF